MMKTITTVTTSAVMTGTIANSENRYKSRRYSMSSSSSSLMNGSQTAIITTHSWDIRLYCNAADHASPYGPLRPNVTSSINRKYITYHNAARGGPSHGHRGSAYKISWRSVEWFQRYALGQTDRHTDRRANRQTNWSQYSAPLPGRSNNTRKVMKVNKSRCVSIRDTQCDKIKSYIDEFTEWLSVFVHVAQDSNKLATWKDWTLTRTTSKDTEDDDQLANLRSLFATKRSTHA